LKVREHAKQLPKELIKDITLKSAERSLLSTHDGSHFSPKQSPEQYASDRLEEGIKFTPDEKYPDLLVFLTGGHSFYFERRLKNSIFADINLVLTGLNRILEYNVEN